MPIIRGLVHSGAAAPDSLDFSTYLVVVAGERAVEPPDPNRPTPPGALAYREEAVIDDTGAFALEIPDPDPERLPEVEVYGPAGLVVGHRGLAIEHLQGIPIEIEILTAVPRTIEPGPPAAANRPRLSGRVVDSSGATEAAHAQVIIWGVAHGGATQPLSIARTDAHGAFFGDLPRDELERAYGTTSVSGDEQIAVPLEDGRIPSRVTLMVHVSPVRKAPSATKSDCDCASPVPRVPDSHALTSSPETYSVDLGGGRCVSLDSPNRALEEFNYYLVVRTTQPKIAALAIPDSTVTGDRLAGRVSDATGTPIPIDPSARFDAATINAAVGSGTRFTGATVADMARSSALDLLGREMAAIVAHNPRRPLGAKNPIEWDANVRTFQATTVAHGHLLQFTQEWVADAYSLGDLVHSVPLAPCEKKQIAIVDWERRERARREETEVVTDSIIASIERGRDVSDIVGAALSESVRGGSTASNWGVGGGLGGAASYMGMGAVLGVSAGGGGSSASSWQDASRQLSASSLQWLRDRTMQSASDLRTARRTTVTTVSQGETSRVETSVIHNHNHCHAVTIEYFEVLRHLQVRQYLAGVTECLLVPLTIKPFERLKTARWKEPLRQSLRDRTLDSAFDAVDRLVLDYRGLDVPMSRYADDPLEHIAGSLGIVFSIVRPLDNPDGSTSDPAWAFLNTLLTRIGLPIPPDARPSELLSKLASVDISVFANPLAVLGVIGDLIGGGGSSGPPPLPPEEKDRIFQTKLAPMIAAAFCRALTFQFRPISGEPITLDLVPTLVDPYAAGASLRVSLNLRTKAKDLDRATIDGVIVSAGADLLPASSRALLHDIHLDYRTAHFRHTLLHDTLDEDLVGPAALVDAPLDAAETRNPRFEDSSLADRLIAHLNDHLEYYHRAIWMMMDPERRYMLLDGVAAPSPNPEGRSIASVVENRLIGIVGNSLVFPVAPGFKLDPTYASSSPADLVRHYTPDTPTPPMRISAPTRGVYAEAVMGHCNACEKKDESRFWRFEESPCGDEPTPIVPPAADSRRVDPGDLRTKDLGSPIIAMQSAPAAPDPTGLAAALQLLGAANVFGNAAGLDQTQKSALAAMQSSLQAAQQFGSQAASLSLASLGQQAHATQNSDRILQTIDAAQDSGHVTPQQAGALKQQAIKQMIGTSGVPLATDLDTIAAAQKQGLIDEDQAHALAQSALSRLTGGTGEDSRTASSLAPTSAVSWTPLPFDVLGIDVSHHQGAIEWDKVGKWRLDQPGQAPLPIVFAIIKATHGTPGRFVTPDSCFDGRPTTTPTTHVSAHNWKDIAAKAPHILRGAYHWFTPTRDGALQAKHFFDTVKAAGGLRPQDIAPALDVEELPEADSADWSWFIDELVACLEAVRAAFSRVPIIYTFPAWNSTPLVADKRLLGYPLWVAAPDFDDKDPRSLTSTRPGARPFKKYPLPKYPVTPPVPARPWDFLPSFSRDWVIWQIRVASAGEIDGIPGTIDIDLAKSLADVQGLTMFPVSSPDEEP